MVNKNKVLKIILLLLMLICVCKSNVISYANSLNTPDSMLVIDKSTYGKILSTIKNANNVHAEDKIIVVEYSNNGEDCYMYFKRSIYNELKQKEKEEIMEILLGETSNNMSLTPLMRNKIYNFFESQDSEIAGAMHYLKQNVTADFIEARKWFEPFSNPISTIMGFLSIIILAFLSLSTVFDICYLTIPLLQPILERGETDKRPWGVSAEAWKVQKEVEDPKNRHGIMGTYFKRRVSVFFGAALMLAWLISGKIYDVVVYFIDWFNLL